MLKKLIHAKIRPHHPWRTLKFDELAEMYTSMSLRSFGFSLVGVFVPVYLYDRGVSVSSLLLFFTFFFGFRAPAAWLGAHIIGRIGPKHTIAVSTVITVVFFALLLSHEHIGWPLIVLAFTFNLANSLFFVAYGVDFSKIQHKKHGGKELSWLLIFQQSGRALGPVVGGALAGLLIPELTLAAAIIVLTGSLVPLFLTNEPVRTHQAISFKGYPLRPHAKEMLAIGAFQVQNSTLIWLWPLFLVVVVFSENTYEKLGILTGVAIAASIFSARMYGKFIDNSKGSYLLRYGAVMNLFLFNSMALTSGIGGAVAASALGQPTMLACKMPLVKGMFDAAGKEEKYRIVYLAWQEMISGFMKFIFCLALYIASIHYDPVLVIRYGFIAASVIGPLMLLQNFSALKVKAK